MTAGAELTVSMPARNAARFIGEAVASVLRQSGVDLALVVVDDGSTDGTAGELARCDDHRLRVLRLPAPRGIGHCHNLVITATSSPFVAHVDADDCLRPGALRLMVDALKTHPSAGQAFCDYHYVDERGRPLRHSWRAQRRFLARRGGPGTNLRRDLIVHGMMINTLRTYRRAALEAAGPFDETLPYAVDYQMALRIADRFPVVHVPRLLYRVRIHDANVSAHRRWAEQWWRRVTICRRLLRSRGELLGYRPVAVYGLLGLGLLHGLGVLRAAKRTARALRQAITPASASS